MKLSVEGGSVLRTAADVDVGAPVAAEIARTRYDFEQLRVRLGTNGKPMAVRTARDVGARIDRIRHGRGWVWLEPAVARYEAARTLRAA